MQYKNIEIEKINHAAFKLKNQEVVFLDPFKIKEGEEKANLILISHEHFDHCSLQDLEKIAGENTVIIASVSCKGVLEKVNFKVKEIKYVEPGNFAEIGKIKIEAVPAYNLNKFRSPEIPFHPQSDDKVGFVVEMEGVRIYHTGDTDNIPEMKDIKNIDIALLPVSGTYVMTAEEAVEAAKTINPKLAIPMHYSEIVGTIKDAEKFKELSSIPTEII